MTPAAEARPSAGGLPALSRNERSEAAAFDRLAKLRDRETLRTSDLTFSRYRSAVLGSPIHSGYPDRAFSHIGRHFSLREDPRRPLKGLRALDLGAGDGLWSVILSEQGAEVTSIEISPEQVRLARERMALHGLAWDARVGSAFRLRQDFRAASFDLVFVQAVLHHLTQDLPAVYAGMHHVLRKGGLAVVSEPYCGSRRLRRIRERMAWLVPLDKETPDERPLDDDDLPSASGGFTSVTVERFDLFARPARRFLGPAYLERKLFDWDRLILKSPAFMKLAGGVFIALRK